MVKFFSWLAPPTFEDEEQNRVARILHVVLLTLLTGSGLITMVTWLNNRPVTPWLASLGIVVTLVAIWFMRRGYPSQAGLLVLLTFLGILTFLAYKGDGIHDTALVAYPAMVVAAILLLNRRLFIIFLLLLTFSVGFITYSEITDAIITNFDKQLVLSDGIVVIILIVITAVSARLLTDDLINSLNRTRQNERALAEINHQLEQQTKALQASEQQYSDLFEYATDAIFIESTAGDILDVNEKACQLLGYTKEELLSLKVADITPPRSSEEMTKLRSSLENREPQVFEAKNIHKDGTWIDVEVSIRKIDLQDRDVAQVFVRDITERKRTEKALKENEVRLRAIINNIPFDLWVCDAAGRYIMQNAVSLDLVGDLTGKTVDDLNLPPEIKADYKQKHLCALNGQVVRNEIEVTVKGKPRILDSVQYPIRNGQDILGFVGMQIDVTERRQAEAALKEYSERLEEMVTERTQELEATQERLVRQEKLAVLGQMAGSIGHELRNPLGVISNAVYFLTMVLSDTDETVKEYLDLISERAQEAGKIISDLLNLSRNHATDQTEVTILELVDEVLIRHPAPKEVVIVSQIPADLPALFVDPQQIRQVLANLITNAYQAMPNGGQVAITAKTEQNLIILSVTDTGVGMSPEVMRKIFEPLYTTKAKGIGLGLAVSKNLIEINGGSIEVKSVEGRGSAFSVALPARQ